MSLDPHNLLAEVHPDLVKIMESAPQEPQAFRVTYGLRTLTAEAAAVASGHSHTMHSRHLADENYGGKACAVDITPVVDGEVTFTPPAGVGQTYSQMAAQIAAGCAVAGVGVTWGGSWSVPKASAADNLEAADHTRFEDWGHYELPWNIYP